MIEALAVRIDADRLRARHEAMSAIGATGRGGIDRQALTEAEIEARALVIDWARSRGYALSSDPIGNLFIRRPGRERDAAPVLAGSHLDSQPNGGNFDGVYGVLAGLEVLEALDDGAVETDRPIEVVIWTNEEGARFQPTTMGSAVYVGALSLRQALSARGKDGMTVSEALDFMRRKLPSCAPRALATPLHAYVEAHIEQGPILEIGAPEDRRRARHPGPAAIRDHGRRHGSACGHHTAASPPGCLRRGAAHRRRARPGRDRRKGHRPPDDRTVRRLARHDEHHSGKGGDDRGPAPSRSGRARPARQGDPRICRKQAEPCSASVEILLASRGVSFAGCVIEAVREEAARLGHGALDIMSGATHDAAFLARLCPSGMIFVPCRDGISHNEAEFTSLDDMIAGAEVLAGVVRRLSRIKAELAA